VGGTAHTSVPPIFREVVLSDARESTNFYEIVVVLVRKGSYDIEHSKRYGKSGKRKGKSEKPGQ